MVEMDQDFFKTTLNTVPIPLFSRNIYGEYIGCNPAFENFVGKSRDDIIGKHNHDLLPKKWADKELENDQEIVLSRDRQRYEWHLDKPMGGMQDIHIDKAPIMDAADNIIGISCAISDISEVKALEKNLSDSTYRLESLLNALPVAVVVIDFATRKIIDLNPQAMLLLGYSSEQVVGRKCQTIICGGKTDYCPLKTKKYTLEKSESVVTHASGRQIPVLKSIISTEIDNREMLLECFSDISAQKTMEKQLREMAETDFLTGLYNRRHFIGIAEKELSRSKRYTTSVSLMMIDIDWFKNVNDRFGHAAGDEVLKGVARVCQEAIRDIDAVGRLGGEEFAVLLVECDPEGALIVAERIRHTISSNAFPFEDQAIKCTVSIGISGFIQKEDDLEKLMQRADTALYRAKESGRNQTCSG